MTLRDGAVVEGSIVAGRFEVQRQLGEGAEAQVLLAHDLELDLDVVLKTRRIVDDRDLERLRREAGMLMRIVAHRGLPIVRSDLVDGDRYYMISDHVVGSDLHDVVRAQSTDGLPLASALDLIDQLAATLDHLHAQTPPVVHGDVKPENVMVTPDGRAVLVDFGAAMRVGDDRERLGTPGFSAPEILAGEPVSAASDVYSLAAVAVYLLTGLTPKLGTAWPAAMADGNLARLERSIRRALTWDPRGRPWRASEFATSLRDAAEMEIPPGTITLLLLTDRRPDRPTPPTGILTALEASGGRQVNSTTLPPRRSLLVFSRAGDAAAAALSIAGNDAYGIALHAGDLGGWHGATLQQMVDDTIRLADDADDVDVVCSPPVRMLLGGDSSLAFRQLGADQVELCRAAPESRDSPRSSSDAHSTTLRLDAGHAQPWIEARRRTPLAGRHSELHDGLRAIDRSRSEAMAALLVVTGDAGMGKTRLLAELAGRSAHSGELVLVGRCTESGGAFEVFLDALGGDLFPFESGQLERDEEGWVDRRRFFGRIASAISHAGRPVTLVLDDVQWIDGSSLALLAQLLDDVGPSLAVLVGCRPGADRAIIDELTLRPAATLLSLQPLTSGGLGELADHLGIALRTETLDGLHALTRGSPFFGLQLLEHVRASPDLELDRGELPEGVREWVLQRTDRLGDATAAVLAVAALIGRVFEVMMLADVVGDSPLAILEHLEAGLDAGLLVEGDRPGEFGFVHAIVSSTLAESVSTTRRGLLHAAIARRIEENGRSLEHLEAAMHHWFAAERLGDPLHAGEIAAEVATLTTERLAHERAISILDRALSVVEVSPPTADRDRVEARLRVAHGRAHFVATRNDEAIAQLYRAADLAESGNDPTTLAEAALVASLNRRHGLDDPELLRLLDRASATCPPEPAVLPAMLNIRRSRLLPISIPHDQRCEMARLGLVDVEHMDPVDRAMVETEVARACWSPDDADDRVAVTTRIIDAATVEVTAGGPSRWTGVLIEALNLRWAARLQIGDLAGALADADRAARIADDAGTTFLLSRAMMGQAMMHATGGEHDVAESLADAAIAISDRHNLMLVRMTIAYSVGRDRGQQAELAMLEQQLADLIDANDLFIAAFALVHAEAGHLDDARRLLVDLDALEPWPHNWIWLATAVAALETAVIVGDLERVERGAAALHPYAGQWAIAAAELGCWGPIDRVLGLAHAALGRVDEARAALIAARNSSIANSATFWTARCHAGLAELRHEGNDA